MAGATHPFFGNQYTDGGYSIGSFKFPTGLTRETGKQIIENVVLDKVPIKSSTIPSVREKSLLKTRVKTGSDDQWVIPTLIVASIVTVGGYLAYRYFKKKSIVDIPNVGVCENCGEPLTGAKFVPNDDEPYIICKKCCEKNYAHYLEKEDLASPSTDEDANQ